MMMIRWLVCALSLSALVAGCDAQTTTPSPDAAIAPDAASQVCTHQYVETDLAPPGATPPWMGPGADASGALVATPPASGWIVAGTYLRIDPAGRAELDGHLGALIPALMASPGLVALSLTMSAECGTARTLSVWQDEASMMAFVMSAEHVAAMASVSNISRGGTVTEHWVAHDVADAQWPSAFTRIAESEGPFY